MNHDPALPTFRLARNTGLAQAQPASNSIVTLESPATEVMTDLTQVKAATVHPSTTLQQAEQMMIYKGVRMLFVVSNMPHIEGLVTTLDLQDDKRMRVVHARNVRHTDLCVADVMTEVGELDALGYERLLNATVGNVIATLRRLGRNHLLVVQAATEQSPLRVRGVISRAQIERQLGAPIEVTPIANSFSEIERALH